MKAHRFDLGLARSAAALAATACIVCRNTSGPAAGARISFRRDCSWRRASCIGSVGIVEAYTCAISAFEPRGLAVGGMNRNDLRRDVRAEQSATEERGDAPLAPALAVGGRARELALQQVHRVAAHSSRVRATAADRPASSCTFSVSNRGSSRFELGFDALPVLARQVQDRAFQVRGALAGAVASAMTPAIVKASADRRHFDRGTASAGAAHASRSCSSQSTVCAGFSGTSDASEYSATAFDAGGLELGDPGGERRPGDDRDRRRAAGAAPADREVQVIDVFGQLLFQRKRDRARELRAAAGRQ